MNTALEQHRQNFVEALKVRHASPKTVDIRERAVRTFFKYLAEVRLDDVREVTRATVRDYQLWLQGQYSGGTVLTYIMGLRRFFDHLEKTDVVLVNPCAGLLLPPQPNRLPKTVLTVEEAKRRVARAGHADAARHPRPGHPRNVLLDGLAHRRTDGVDGSRRGPAKRFCARQQGQGRQRPRRANGRHGQPLRARILARSPGEVGAAALPTCEERALWLISYEPYRPLLKQTITVMVREYGQAAGLTKPLTAHVWRHTCATHLVANDANLVYVQRLLGHKSLTTTQIYTRVAVPELRVTLQKKHPRRRQAGPAPNALTREQAKRMPQL